ncbi:type II secretion system protein GspM [Parendozoicomonas haliclonae]|uniref:Type II secretion system protein M n=1 Tax=Parendozoicomonas haliclonae TaxID=1960125 RepID=A0A1X7AGA4_9GAMM|nr:type II secretion system protein M [Parendozoicomonas haliclonae]SMA39529.1 Type II secretion system protein M [Parendozoicomonas haliclonae]
MSNPSPFLGLTVFTEQYQQLRARFSRYWHGLSLRERRLFMVMAPVVGVWIIWMGIVYPINSKTQQLQGQLYSNEQMLGRVHSFASAITALKAEGHSVSTLTDQPLNRVINQSASKAKLTISSMRSQADSVQVQLANAPFTQIMDWIANLEQSNIVASHVRFEKTDRPGVVSTARLEFKRL